MPVFQTSYQVPRSKAPKRSVWRWILEPSKAPQEPQRRRQMHLLSWLLVVVIPLGALSATVQLFTVLGFLTTFLAIMGAEVLMMIAYGLNRVGRYVPAALLMVGIPTVTSFLSLGVNPADYVAFSFLLLSVLLASMLLTLRSTILVALVNVGGVLLLPAITPAWSYSEVAGPLGLNIIFPALIVVGMRHRDLIERDRQAELRESEERWRMLVEHNPEPITITIDGKIAYMNAAGLRLFGAATLDEVLHTSPTDYIHSSLHEVFWERQAILRRGEATEPFVYWIIQRNGEKRLVEALSISIVYNSHPASQTVFRDVTARREAKQALQDSEEQFRMLSEAIPQQVWTAQPDGKLDYVSKRVQDYFNRTFDALIGAGWTDVVHPEDLPGTLERWTHALETGEPYEVEFRLQRAHDRMYRWHLARALSLRDEAGHIIKWFGTNTDITERVQADEALQESEARYRLLMEESPFGVQIFDPDGTLVHANKAWETMWGARAEDVVGKFNALKDPQLEALGLKNFIGRAFAGETLDFHDTQFDPSQSGMPGGKRYVRAHCYHIRDKNGHLQHVVLLSEDITERQQAAESLQASEVRNRALLDGIPDMMFRLRTNGTFLDYKAEAEEELAVPSEAIIGSTLAESPMPAELVEDLMRCVREAVVMDEIQTYEYELAVPIGVQTYEARIVRSGSDEAVCIVRNVTERKQAEAEQARLIEELEARNAELERFTYTVSHDLKTPLVTIKGFLGLLMQDATAGDEEALERDVEHISNAADKMGQLLNELLELSRIGHVINPSEEVSLTELVHETLKLMADQIHERGVVVDLAPALPVVFGDRTRLLEVLQNLIDNAIKFMGDQPEPRIEIGSRRDGQEVVCYMRDNGIGIAPPYHEKIFGLFDRLVLDVEGTGIGLALVKRIIEFHGGRIWVESEGEEHGSTFCFTLPV